MLSVDAGNDPGCPSIDVVFLGFDDSSCVTGIELFADAALRRYREEYIMQTFAKVGLDALLTPENCVLLLVDHQPFQLANVNSHEPTMVINNVTGLAKIAKAYGIPTILTTV